MSLRLSRRRTGDESGSMLVELLIAMTFLTITVGALISVFASSLISLRHTSVEGNALTLVDKRMEVFKTLRYSAIKLDATSIPASTDPYVTSPPSNLTAAQKSGITNSQLTGGTYTATQNVTGPDNRSYRVDTYMFTATPTSSAGNGRPVTQVTVSARLLTGGTPSEIKAHATSSFDLASTQPPPA